MFTHPTDFRSDRRRFLRLGAIFSGALTACKPTRPIEQAEPSSLGGPLSPYGERSPSEKVARLPGFTRNPEIGSSRTPLQDSYGILTPSSLHFERHHSGVPRIDPAAHRLLLHGMVDRPLMLTLEETAAASGDPSSRPTRRRRTAWLAAANGRGFRLPSCWPKRACAPARRGS